MLDLSAGRGLASALTEGCITCLADEKDFFLYYFLQRYPGRTLVFVNRYVRVVQRADVCAGFGLPSRDHADRLSVPQCVLSALCSGPLCVRALGVSCVRMMCL